MKTFTAPLALTAGLALGTLAPGTIASARADAAMDVAFSGYELKTLQYDFAAIQGRESSFIQVECPDGKRALGGGVQVRDAENRLVAGIRIVENGPSGETAWIGGIVPADGAEGFPAAGRFTTKVICAVVE